MTEKSSSVIAVESEQDHVEISIYSISELQMPHPASGYNDAEDNEDWALGVNSYLRFRS